MAILPLTLVVLAELALGGVTTVAVSEGMAYVGDTSRYRSSPFQIVDVHDPTAPTAKWSRSGPPIPVAISVVGKTAYVAGAGERSADETRKGTLEIFDVEDVSAPRLLGVLPLPSSVSFPDELVVADNIAYIAYRFALLIIDVHDPTAPRLLTVYGCLPEDEMREDGSVPEGQFIGGIAVEGSRVYLAKNGLKILDVTDLRSPREVGAFSILGETSWISVHSNIAYIGAFYRVPPVRKTRWARLLVVDVSNPAKPVCLKKISISTVSFEFAFSNGVLYTSDFDRVFVYDLRDLRLPYSPSQLTTSSKTIGKDGLIVSGTEGKFSIWDISESLSPELLSTYPVNVR